MQVIAWARDFAFDKAGNSIDAKIAIIAITTRSSISVNPPPGTLGRVSAHPNAPVTLASVAESISCKWFIVMRLRTHERLDVDSSRPMQSLADLDAIELLRSCGRVRVRRRDACQVIVRP